MIDFLPGDIVRNINPKSRYFALTGIFLRFSPFVFSRTGCDVWYQGHAGPYGYPAASECAQDLLKIAHITELLAALSKAS
jgi:hypothetical protein